MVLHAVFSACVEFVRAHWPFICSGLVLVALIWQIRSYAKLSHIPGPLLAANSNLVRLNWVLTRKAHLIHIDLHRKYGKLVRFGPNMVSVGDTSEVQKLYGFGVDFKKSDFYHVILPTANGKVVQTVFATQSNEIHRTLRKPVASIYSMSNLVTFESYVDSTCKVFFQQLDERFGNGALCDIGLWLQFFAFDVMGEITFSKRLGFLEQAKDVGNAMHSIWNNFERTAWVGMMPWLDYIWHKNPLRLKLQPSTTSPIVAFAAARTKERLAEMADPAASKKSLNGRDFLSRFIHVVNKDPTLPPLALTAWTTSNVLAGSDSTAIVLRTIVYNLLNHPESRHALEEELERASQKGRLSNPVTWRESQQLPYLDACVREAGRLHPALGLPLERVVPAGGVEVSGQYLPEGTIVGMNAWVVHRDTTVFGKDCEEWRPERWLEIDVDTRRQMEQSLLTFGAGGRVCLGKNIALLEIFKLIPTLFRNYDIELTDPNHPWKVENRWFVPQFQFNVCIRRKSQKKICA